ncbi:hypothetical protein, partial [Flavobacterium sp. 3-210]
RPLLATTFVAISPRVAALIIAASPRVAVLSVITGLIPRHVYAPYLLCKGEYLQDYPNLIRLRSRST